MSGRRGAFSGICGCIYVLKERQEAEKQQQWWEPLVHGKNAYPSRVTVKFISLNSFWNSLWLYLHF